MRAKWLWLAAAMVTGGCDTTVEGSDDTGDAGDRDTDTDTDSDSDSGDTDSGDTDSDPDSGDTNSGDTAAPQRPEVVTLGDRRAVGGDTLQLDASGSTDPNGDALTFSWSGPAELTLNDATSATPTVVLPNEAGEYIFVVEVSDGVLTSTATVVVTVVPRGDSFVDVRENPWHGTWWEVTDPGGAVDLVAVGDDLWVTQGEAGLQRVSIADPVAPAPLNSLVTGDLGAIAAHNSVLAVASAGEGIVMVDVADPDAPKVLTTYDGAGLLTAVRTVAVTPDTVWVARINEVMSIDISDPANPVAAGSIDLGANVLTVAASGEVLWVGTRDGVFALDGSTPSGPTVIKQFDPGLVFGRVTVGSTHVAWFNNTHRVVMNNVNDPATSSVVQAFSSGSTGRFHGDELWLVDGGEVLVFNTADFTTPQHRLPNTQVNPLSWLGVSVGARVYAPAQRLWERGPWDPDAVPGLSNDDYRWGTGVSVLDPARTNTAEFATDITTVASRSLDKLVVEGDQLWVGVRQDVIGLDLAASGGPAENSRVSLDGQNEFVHDVSLSEDGRLAVPHSYGFDVWDVTDATAPVHVAALQSTEVSLYGVDVRGDVVLASVANGGGLWAWDISSPFAPVELGRNLKEAGWELQRSGDTVAMADGFGLLSVFDVTDPAATVRTASRTVDPSYGSIHSLDLRGDLVAFAGESSVGVVDISDPAVIRTLGITQNPGFDNAGLVLEDGRAWFANGYRGLTAMHIEDADHAALGGRWRIRGGVQDAAVHGDDLLVGGQDGVLRAFPKLTLPVLSGVTEPVEPGSVHVYVVSWADRGAADVEVSCRVAVGTCVAHDVDITSRTASVTYTAPSLVGEHHLAVVVAGFDAFEVANAWIDVGI